MTKPLTEVETLARSHSLRRWIVRIALGLLLVLFLLGLAGMALTSSGMSIEDAEVAFKQFKAENATVSSVERLWGKPLFYRVANGSLWIFTKSSVNDLELFVVVNHSRDEGLNTWWSERSTLTGWESWKFRWQLLKLRLGIDQELVQ
ncbi:MAG: hypothetical protein QM703_13595 [Gemmatales bacterium]